MSITDVLPLSQPLKSNLKHQPHFSTWTFKSFSYGTVCWGYFGPKICTLVSANLTDAKCLEYPKNVFADSVRRAIIF